MNLCLFLGNREFYILIFIILWHGVDAESGFQFSRIGSVCCLLSCYSVVFSIFYCELILLFKSMVAPVSWKCGLLVFWPEFYILNDRGSECFYTSYLFYLIFWFFFNVCVCVHACVIMTHLYVPSPQKLEGGVRVLEAGVTVLLRLLTWVLGTELGL